MTTNKRHEAEEEAVCYKVLVNHEDQYSIWPLTSTTPLGWSETSKSGSRTECLNYIEEVWTDMRPLSLRKAMSSSSSSAG
jgi:MbtH protein